MVTVQQRPPAGKEGNPSYLQDDDKPACEKSIEILQPLIRCSTSCSSVTLQSIIEVTQSSLVNGDDHEFPKIVYQEISGTGSAPWEIHRPQRALMQIARQGAFGNKRVMDLGCGIGDNALYLAECGGCVEVVACDFISRGLDMARTKEKLRRMVGAVQWKDLDITSLPPPPELLGRFDALLDCATFHGMGDSSRPKYRSFLSQICQPGGVLYIMGFSDKWPATHVGGPRRLTHADFTECFSPEHGWEVVGFQDITLENHPSINRCLELDETDPQQFEKLWRGLAEAVLAVIRRC